jgi:hypothetical protein
MTQKIRSFTCLLFIPFFLASPPALAQTIPAATPTATPTIEIDRVSEQCEAAIVSAVSRIQERRTLDVEVTRRNHAEGYPDGPSDRPFNYSFSVTGASARIVTDSPRFMNSISTNIINNCETVSMVSFLAFTPPERPRFPFRRLRGEGIFGLIDTDRISEFSCEPPQRGRELPWGQVSCGE